MAVNIKIADSTKVWLDELHAKGAVIVNAAGETEIHPQVRAKITEIHSILDPNNPDTLEGMFDQAVADTSDYNKSHPGTLTI